MAATKMAITAMPQGAMTDYHAAGVAIALITLPMVLRICVKCAAVKRKDI